MTIWHKPFSLAEINALASDELIKRLQIAFTEIGSDFLAAEMPVGAHNTQMMGILNGGATCVLAETLASVAANCSIDFEQKICVGLEINVNHLRAVSSGVVKAVAKPLHLGRTTQVWEIRVYNEAKQLSAVSRLTVSVLDRKK